MPDILETTPVGNSALKEKLEAKTAGEDRVYFQSQDLDILIKEIDPAQCRPWKYHNRDTAWLTQERCQDLISSIETSGQNEPALVRALFDDPHYRYEIIYGVRRWFACSQIPNHKLLARITDVDDKTCMILMHSENAFSRDISEFERAFSFAKQMKSGVFKNQTEMARAMGLSQGTISKMIQSAEIFDYPWINILFQHKLDIPLKYAYVLSTLLKWDKNITQIKKEADHIQKEIAETKQYPSATNVLKRLIAHVKPDISTSGTSVIMKLGNKAVISCRRNKFGMFSIFIEDEAKTLNRKEVEAACLKAIGEYVFQLFPEE